MPRTARVVAAAAVMVLAVAVGPAAVAASPDVPARAEWSWPVLPAEVTRPFAAPAHRYGAGHRGIDLRADAGVGVHAPADGIVAFAGSVAGRPIVTVDHGDGYVTTLEPVAAVVDVGVAVAAGDEVGVAAAGGHTAPGSVHFGVRLHGEYINPLALLSALPRAVLLPCC